MLTDKDITQLRQLGISEDKVYSQIHDLKNGYSFLNIYCAATVGKGIVELSDAERNYAIESWHEYRNSNANLKFDKSKRILKFVPASGAASRMFKSLYEFKNSDFSKPLTHETKLFFDRLSDFAFYDDLNSKSIEVFGEDIPTSLSKGLYKQIIELLLDKPYMSYGQLPKGLLKFHKQNIGVARTPIEEHLVEGALYAKNSANEVNIHFTVSPEHADLFKQFIDSVKTKYENKFGVKYNIEFSLQKKSTDTVALNTDGSLVRNSDESILFRPAGHGALIENLNDLVDYDIVFIKNIDNVVPDRFKADTIVNKELLAGVLVIYQQKIFHFIKLLNQKIDSISENLIDEMFAFAENVLFIKNSTVRSNSKSEQIAYLLSIFNRPIRVCGMVKNEGEPGGGPYLVYDSDESTISPQILESSQIDKSNNLAVECMQKSQFFNPVDLVCGIRDYKGDKFDLLKYVDYNTGFISEKSKDGKSIRVLELPGLWNGSMSRWNTIFIEVPITTFNPVKTVNDLLREEHQ